MEWIVKKRFDFPSEMVPHINWESFVPLADIWGRLVIEKDFATGATSVEAQAPAEDVETVVTSNFPPFPASVCRCDLCLVIMRKEAARRDEEMPRNQ